MVTVRRRLTERGATLALVKQSRKLARETSLQTGQARLGALGFALPGARPRTLASDGTSPSGSPGGSHCRGVACEPCAPVGQVDHGDSGTFRDSVARSTSLRVCESADRFSGVINLWNWVLAQTECHSPGGSESLGGICNNRSRIDLANICGAAASKAR